jgi:hypothetical protein
VHVSTTLRDAAGKAAKQQVLGPPHASWASKKVSQEAEKLPFELLSHPTSKYTLHMQMQP